MISHTFLRCHAIAASIIPAAFALAACSSNGTAAPGASVLPQQAAPAATHAKSLSQCPCVYAVDGAIFSGSGAVTVYPVAASKNTAPIETITGSNTGLGEPNGVALDSSNNIWVSNTHNSYSIFEYAAGANGNVAPIATISGSNTDLVDPSLIALDSKNNIYVSNYSGDTVAVFAAGSNGNVSPIQLISGSNTGLNTPAGIAVDASDNIYVSNYNGESITEYAAGSTGNVSPIATISGSATDLGHPVGISLDADDNIYVANSGYPSGTPSIEIFAAGSNGNVAPTATIAGTKTKFQGAVPYDVALDASGNLHVPEENKDTIATFAAGAHGNVKPSSTLKGKKTDLNSPVSLFIR